MLRNVFLFWMPITLVFSTYSYSQETTTDQIVGFLKANVIDRELRTLQWNSMKFNEEDNKYYQVRWIRTAKYSNLKPTSDGFLMDYSVYVKFETFEVEKKKTPKGDPIKEKQKVYDTLFRFELLAYPDHDTVYGVMRIVHQKVNDEEAKDIPTMRQAKIYLSDDNSVLHLDRNFLYPKMKSSSIPGTKPKLRITGVPTKFWIEKGRLNRTELFQNYNVDPKTLKKDGLQNPGDKPFHDYEEDSTSSDDKIGGDFGL